MTPFPVSTISPCSERPLILPGSRPVRVLSIMWGEKSLIRFPLIPVIAPGQGSNPRINADTFPAGCSQLMTAICLSILPA